MTLTGVCVFVCVCVCVCVASRTKISTKLFKNAQPLGEFPGGPVVRTPTFHCRGHWFDPWSSGN